MASATLLRRGVIPGALRAATCLHLQSATGGCFHQTKIIEPLVVRCDTLSTRTTPANLALTGR